MTFKDFFIAQAAIFFGGAELFGQYMYTGLKVILVRQFGDSIAHNMIEA